MKTPSSRDDSNITRRHGDCNATGMSDTIVPSIMVIDAQAIHTSQECQWENYGYENNTTILQYSRLMAKSWHIKWLELIEDYGNQYQCEKDQL